MAIRDINLDDLETYTLERSKMRMKDEIVPVVLVGEMDLDRALTFPRTGDGAMKADIVAINGDPDMMASTFGMPGFEKVETTNLKVGNVAGDGGDVSVTVNIGDTYSGVRDIFISCEDAAGAPLQMDAAWTVKAGAADPGTVIVAQGIAQVAGSFQQPLHLPLVGMIRYKYWTLFVWTSTNTNVYRLGLTKHRATEA